MKEKDPAKKLAMKKKRQAKLIRKELKSDLASFICQYHFKTTARPEEVLSSILWYGFKGYEGMRSKDLKTKFDGVYKQLRSGEVPTFQYDANNCKISRFKNDEQAEVLAIFMEKSELLMTRLIELAFDLDFEG